MRSVRAPSAVVLVLACAFPAYAQGDKAASGDALRIDKRPTDDLVKALSGTDPAEREIAERELASRKKAAIPPLVNLLDRAPSAEARVSAVKILRRISDPAASDALLRVYKDSALPSDVRADAAMALGENKALAAIPALLDGLDDLASLKVCESARGALELMGVGAEDSLVSAYNAELAKKKDARENVLYRLILVLGRVGGNKSRDALVATLKNNDPKDPRAVALRHHAAIALGTTGDKLAIEPLVIALEAEKEFNVAKYIARSLEWLTNEKIPPVGTRWRAWWETNKGRYLAPKNRYNPLPKEGIGKEPPKAAEKK